MERRDFLRSVAALGLTELAVVACSSSNKELPPIPDKIPDDIVSEEELQQLGVHIYNTDKVRLMLRKSALRNFPVFDALKQKDLESFAIVLIGAEDLSSEHMRKLNDGAREMFDLEREKGIRWSFPNVTNLNDPNFRAYIGNEQKEVTLEEASYFNWDGYLAGNAYGRYISGRDIAIKAPGMKVQYPDVEKKDGIYLAVGGRYEPNPSQSYPNPKNIVKPSDPQSTYLIDYLGSKMTPLSLVHEMKHHESTGETLTDRSVINYMQRAYDGFRRGDNSQYGIVFQTAAGITITNNFSGVGTPST